MDDHLKETLISGEVVYEGSFLRVRRDRVRLPDGSALGTASALNPHVATAGQAILAAQTVQSAPANLVGRTIEAVEQEMILDTLKHCYGNRTHAAQILGISIRTLRNKLHEYRAAGVTVPPIPGQMPASATVD